MLPSRSKPLFSLIKCTPDRIEMLNHQTHQVFVYSEPQSIHHHQPSSQNGQQSYDSQIFLKAQPLEAGYIYPKQLMTMEAAIKQRKSITANNYPSSHYVENFTEQELQNTFMGIIEWALVTAKMYKCFRLSNILIDQEGNIKLKDPVISRQCQESDSDIKAIGILIYRCCTLNIGGIDNQKVMNLRMMVAQLKNYTSSFITKVWIMLNEIKGLYKYLLGESVVPNQQYNKIKGQVDRIRSSMTPSSQNPQQIGKSSPKKLKDSKDQPILKRGIITLISSQNKDKKPRLKTPKYEQKEHGLFRNRKLRIVPPLSLIQKNENANKYLRNRKAPTPQKSK